jgi:flagellar biosynthetic protein FlhB
MASDSGDKTEPPTGRRRTEAREQGQIARSQDLSSALLLMGALLSLGWFGPHLMRSLINAMREYLTTTDPVTAGRVDVVPLVTSVVKSVLVAAGPILIAVMLVGILSNFVQVGFLLTTRPLEPKWDRLNPFNGIKRLFSTRTLVQLLMNLLKLTMVSWVAYVAISKRTDEILLAISIGGWHQVAVLAKVLYQVGIQLAAILLVIALIDYGWQRFKFERDLRMTKEEVKEEMRRMEGDPIVKQRRRRMQFAAAIQRIRKAVPKADVVVTNPTEFAIAIQYDAREMRAPTVVAKGQGYLAQKIREIAVAHGIPIVERKPLAQALYKTVEVGQEVPEKFYQAVAEILAYVYELSGKTRRRRRNAAVA